MELNTARHHLVAKLVVVLSIALALKQFYSTASVNELHWILAPTTLLVELITSRTFYFEMHAGYMSSDRSFLIATSCAGVNFLIAAFLMLSAARLWRNKLTWQIIPGVLAVSYVTTIVANTVRISTALHLQDSQLDFAGLSGNQLHRLEGIVIYFGFLLLLFLMAERTTSETNKANNCFGRPGQFMLPLVVYYATTLGTPLANAIYQREFAAAFLEHSVFVVCAPLLLMVPFAFIAQIRGKVLACLTR